MEFEQFHDFVYKELGLKLNSYKQTQLNRRIGSLMERRKIGTLEDYVSMLSKDKDERSILKDFVTINVTEFFRNEDMFNRLTEVLKEDSKTKRNLKVWSAGCSIGCEPYTLAMILNELDGSFTYSIEATDIDDTVLTKAKSGKFSESEIKTLDKKYKDKYFSKDNDNYTIDIKVSSKVKFIKQDLILDSYGKDYDLILCRNVTIYFKETVKDKIIRRFVDSLKVGGILFVGATESIHNFRDIGLEKLSPFIYRKV